MRIAILGAGPSGFSVAGEFLKRYPGGEVHLFEKRVAPYGLVRYGVAPDHQLTRRATNLFNQIADQDRFHYYGNVEIGRDVPLAEIQSSFHAVVICTGAEQPNRPDIPGALLPGAVDALDFARWTNGEPEAFAPELLNGIDTVVIIGNGNVAMDAARMLMRPSREWVTTDIAPFAMEALMHHRVKHIVIAGRRGPHETSFSEAEWTEVVSMPDWSVQANGNVPFGPLPEKPASDQALHFRFHLNPVCLLGETHVVGMRFSQTMSGDTVDIPAQLVVFATGQRGAPMPGIPFDASLGIIPNTKGAVTKVPGLYVCGWIKRGGKGLIGVNRKDAVETVARLLEDRDTLSARQPEPINWRDELPRRGVRAVSWAEWKHLETMEMQRGSIVGRPRVNFTREEALALLSSLPLSGQVD